jgi:hypothetical protein
LPDQFGGRQLQSGEASRDQSAADKRHFGNLENGDMSNAMPEPHEHPVTVLETEPRDSRIARRNMQVGIWAGAQLKLSQEGRAAYALAVMVAGMIDSGHDDVIDKITRDFAKHGVPITRKQVRLQLSRHRPPH